MNRYSIVQGADDPNAFLRGLNRESFNVDPYRRKVVGLFGEQERADPQQRYRLPETFSAEALSMMDPAQLERLLSIADRQYDTVEQNWQSVTPNGYTGIFATEDGPLEGPDPMADPENQRRAAALQAIQEAQGNIKAALAQREQARLRNENQLLGGVAELGYDFAPGSLGDASVRQEIWDARDYLPQFLRNAAQERRYIGGPGDRFRQDGYSWRAPQPWQEGVEVDPPTDLGIPMEEGTYSGPFGQQMPYNPADPLSEAAYYGGLPVPNPLGVLDPDVVDRIRKQRAALADPAAPMRNYTESGYPDDRIVRDAGNTAYNDLRPGFYNAGSITGPSQPVFQAPQYEPQKPVFEAPKMPRFEGMELRPGVRVRNPFDVSRVGPRPSRSMFS